MRDEKGKFIKNHDECIKHGFRNTRFYGIWCNLKQRCANPNFTYYKYYGGRGINCGCWNEFMKNKDAIKKQMKNK